MSAAPVAALCAAASDLADPMCLGLPSGTSLDAPWLATFSSAFEARSSIASLASLKEAWVASSEEVAAVNLAAALKADNPALSVRLIGDRPGSVRSCARAAGIDGVLDAREFADRFRAVAAAAEGAAAVSDGISSGLAEPSVGGGFLLAVVSGSGGTGKSTVSVLAARLLASRGLRTALLDGDLQFGDLHELAGPCPRLSVEEAADDPSVLDATAGEPLVLLCAPRSLERSEVVAGRFAELLSSLTARFDAVVVNTGGSWSDQHALLLERAAASVFLVDQRASSVRACRHALDLCLRCGIATGSFLFAVNRCTRHAPFTSIDVSTALRGAHVTELADGGREVEELLGAGMAEQLVAAGNGLCASIDKMLDEVLPARPRPLPTGRESVVARIGLASAPRRARRRGRKGQKHAPSPSRGAAQAAPAPR